MTLEEDFFATEDAQSRADLYADFDPDAQPAKAERRIFLFIGVGLLVVLGIVYALMPDAESAADAPQSSPSVAAKTPVSQAPASTAPPAHTSRLARLLKKNASAAGAASSPPIPAPAVESFQTARTHIEAGEFDQALTSLGSAKTFEANALRGWALYELGRDADARQALRSALDERPDHLESLLLLGSLEQSRDHSAAKQTYEAFLAAHPNAPQAQEVRQILDRI